MMGKDSQNNKLKKLWNYLLCDVKVVKHTINKTRENKKETQMLYVRVIGNNFFPSSIFEISNDEQMFCL